MLHIFDSDFFSKIYYAKTLADMTFEPDIDLRIYLDPVSLVNLFNICWQRKTQPAWLP